MPKILAFFPETPWPPQSGNHQRCLELLTGFAQLGYDAAMVSSSTTSGVDWSQPSIEGLQARGIQDVRVHRLTPWDYRLKQFIKRFVPPLSALPMGPTLPSPPGLKRLFLKTALELKPEIILMNYAYWDSLVDHEEFSYSTRVIDTHDLVTLGQRYQKELRKYLPSLPMRLDAVDDRILQEDFFDSKRIMPDPMEFRIYDKYDFTLAISAKEADIIRQNTQKTRVLFVPMTQEPRDIVNRYTGPALFPAGPNLFNVQGYLCFVKRVLPLIRRKAPDFLLRMTGRGTQFVYPEPGVSFSGIVPDLKPFYEEACFLVSPLIGGTGQQVKIVEAMAHGVPAITFRTDREALPLRHGINGFIAATAAEFADYVLTLWKDRKLCAQLGHAARETIRKEFSRECLIEKLSVVTNDVACRKSR